MKKLIYIAILGMLYMAFNELEDESVRNRWDVHESFLNSSESWKNKYELNEGMLIEYQKQWYHFGIEPAYKEAFPYSTTLFVSITDGEHLFQFLKNLSILGALLVINWRVALAFFIGSRAGSFIKELIKKIQ